MPSVLSVPADTAEGAYFVLYVKTSIIEKKNIGGIMMRRIREEITDTIRDPIRGEALQSEIAKCKKNFTRNRCVKCLPYDFNRVKVTKSSNNELGYINASYITLSDDARYIMASVPPKSEFGEFWKMAFEQKSPFVVMLTHNVGEAYYPQNYGDKLSFSGYKVSCLGTERNDGFIARAIRIKGSSNIHDLIHFQFLGWNDNATTEDVAKFLKFYEIVTANAIIEIEPPQKKEKGLMALVKRALKSGSSSSSASSSEPPASKLPIIQCSDGCERSGAFVLIDFYLKSLRNSSPDNLSIEDMVRKLKLQRNYCVQDQVELEFIYNCILNYLRSKYPELNESTPLLKLFVRKFTDDLTYEEFVNPEKWPVTLAVINEFIAEERAEEAAQAAQKEENKEVYAEMAPVYSPIFDNYE